MSDQKEMKKRLKVLMTLPENQICSDCNERQPRWASLIVPPPGAPEGSGAIGAFCCLECSGSHRRLGVHISFVRSVNLDSWKEKEVQAMENGGNAKVNAIFEANLGQNGGAPKPTNHADGPTRERFIRDKYERRKFYNPAGFYNAAAAAQQQEISVPAWNAQPVGPPSDAAKQRMEARKTLRKSHSGMSTSSSEGLEGMRSSDKREVKRTASMTSGGRRKPKAAPVSAPVPTMDLLDFLTPDPAPSRNASQNFSASQTDLFDFAKDENDGKSLDGNPPSRTPSGRLPPPRRSSSIKKKPSAPSPAPALYSADILSLYSATPTPTPSQQQNMNNMTNMMQSMSMQQPPQQVQPNMMSMQQQQQKMMMQQQLMMQQYQQQQMMMYRQQMMQGGMQGNNNMMFTQQGGGSAFGGSPMGSGPSMTSMQTPVSSTTSSQTGRTKAPEKDDPFAQFAMNAFRP